MYFMYTDGPKSSARDRRRALSADRTPDCYASSHGSSEYNSALRGFFLCYRTVWADCCCKSAIPELGMGVS
jgi:hypothetical protein